MRCRSQSRSDRAPWRRAVVTINRPHARNAINKAVAEGIAAAMDTLDGDPELSVGILTGAGGTFCPGWTSRRSYAARRRTSRAAALPG